MLHELPPLSHLAFAHLATAEAPRVVFVSALIPLVLARTDHARSFHSVHQAGSNALRESDVVPLQLEDRAIFETDRRDQYLYLGKWLE